MTWETALITAIATVLSVSVTGAVTLITKHRSDAAAKATADANTSVAASADNREWAKFWMERATSAEQKAAAAEERVDDWEVHFDEVTSIFVRHIRVLEAEVTRLGGTAPQMPDLPRLHPPS